MFTERIVETGKGRLHYRRETLTGLSCRISTERRKRRIDLPPTPFSEARHCPFCPGNLPVETPVFPDGKRIEVGESVTFPNLYPFAGWHTVTVITREHTGDSFTVKQLRDAFMAQAASLSGQDGYPSINWNLLPSAGASIAHPHLQGLVDPAPSFLASCYLAGSSSYRERTGRCYGTDLRIQEAGSPRYLFGDEILWTAHAVPLGEREVRALLPVSHLSGFTGILDPFVDGLVKVLRLYRVLGTHALNLSLFFDREGEDHGFSAFCSVIARINPNDRSMSDSAFMERLHLEPVILTLPEDFARMYREKRG
jgi:UDPglucose--hexose-1-phosphate uridylyltransferase